MKKTLVALALTLSFTSALSAQAVPPFLPDFELDTQDIGVASTNALNDIASYNDTNSDNEINSNNWTKVEDQDDVGSYNDVNSFNDLNSYNTAQSGLINADDYSSNYVGNLANGHNNTILDGDVNVGGGGLWPMANGRGLGLGLGGGDVAANTGIMDHSIVGEDNAQFGDTGVALNGGAGLAGAYTSGSINNNQNQLNLVTFPH